MKMVSIAVVSLVAAGLLAACSSGATKGSSSSGPADQGYLTENHKAVQAYLSATGTFQAPPTTAPKPQAGKRVALVSCGQVFSSCALEIAAAQAAAQKMGWKAQVIDSTNGDPTAAVPGIKSAIADKVDAIFVYYVDCTYIKDALEDAKTAKIPVIQSNSYDCNETDSGAQSYYQPAIKYNVGDGSYNEWLRGWINSQVDYAIDKLDGKAKLAFFSDETGAASRALFPWVKDEVAKCTTCSYVDFKFPVTDIGTALQGNASTFLLKHAEVNAVIPGYGTILSGGLSAAISAAHIDATVSASDGLETGISLMKEGKADFGSGLAYEWEGYAAMDTLNRIFHGEPAANSGIGLQIFDKDNNMPKGESWEPPFNFVDLYDKAWGV
jgi:ribose transport system substrate-binding protein